MSHPPPAPGLLEPGAHRASGMADDDALVAAMLQVEIAWMHALADGGAVKADQVDAVVTAAERLSPRLDAHDVEAAGNPVLPLVRSLRAAVSDSDAAALVHVGLTSQDVLDTALMLVAQDAVLRISVDLNTTALALEGLVRAHRDSVMVGRTLTQYAVPVTFGLKAAHWLVGVLDANDAVTAAAATLPVQYGGAAGTAALAAQLLPDPLRAGAIFAERLGLAWPGMPWHTRRTPVTRLADALVQTCDALGVIATDVLLMNRPEIAELREGAVDGRGASSTMPHKRNPVLSVLVRSAALQAPLLGAQLHTCSAQSVDERPDGAWHAEWPTFRRLLTVSVTAASQAAELVAGLQIDVESMARRADAAAADLLAERGGAGDPNPRTYLGATGSFVDAALSRAQSRQQVTDGA